MYPLSSTFIYHIEFATFSPINPIFEPIPGVNKTKDI